MYYQQFPLCKISNTIATIVFLVENCRGGSDSNKLSNRVKGVQDIQELHMRRCTEGTMFSGYKHMLGR